MTSQSNATGQDPHKIEKELGEFLNKKFGGNVKILSPSIQPKKEAVTGSGTFEGKKQVLGFNTKPSELIAYLDQYVVKQEKRQAVLNMICKQD